MEKIKKVLSGKSFTYYVTTAFMVVAVIGILIILNLFLQKKDWKLDLTADKRYSITQDTKDYISTKLKKDVNIMVFKISEEGFGNYYRNVIDEYKNLSPKVKVEEFDPDKNPAMARKYGLQTDEAVIIVESGKKFRKISIQEIYSDYMSETASLESKLTGAINYVSDDREIKGYLLKGHGEIGLKNIPTLDARLKDSGMKLEELDLVTKKEVPTDASALIIAGARADLSDDEKLKIENYLKANGKLMLMLGRFDETPVAKLKNMSAILKAYNMEAQDDVVFETSESNFMVQPYFFIPELQQDEITKAVIKAELRFSMPQTRSIKILPEKIEGLTVTSLAKTTDKSWGETNLTERAVLDDKDIKGPMDVVVKAEKIDNTTKLGSKLIVYGDFANIADEYFRQYVSAGNVELFAAGMKWLTDNKETISITPKNFKNENVSFTSTQTIVIAIIIVLLPILFVIAGVYVWRVRRRL